MTDRRGDDERGDRPAPTRVEGSAHPGTTPPGTWPAAADAGPGDRSRPAADPSRSDGQDGQAQGSAGVEAGDEHRRQGSALRALVEWVAVIVGALAVALVLRAVLFQAYWIPSESMEPTLQRDDRVLVNRLSYRLGEVERGDVVVFERPPGEAAGGIRDLIKRVVALEGETVEGRGGQVLVDGVPIDELYVAEAAPIGDFGPVVVPEGHVFVMGDNRGNSVDSRSFGPIDDDRIVGRAFVLFWPLDRLGWL